MVYRDYWALSQWYAHYSRHLGSRNLYIVAHGHDPKVAELCPLANVITVPRDTLAGFDRARARMLNSIQDGLAVAYDWVIRTDVDELICLDPVRYADFDDFFRRHNRHTSLFALGLNVAEAADDAELSMSDVALSSRVNAVFSGHYSKAFAVKRGTHLVRHGIRHAKDAQFTLPRGVYLVHLKYANTDALQISNEHRTLIANGDEGGLPGLAWSDAERDALRFFHSFERLPEVNWADAEADAYKRIAETPETEADMGVMRARSVKFDCRTKLPEWFKYS